MSNALKQPVNIGGTKLNPGDSAWTPLEATIVIPNSTFAKIQDVGVKDKDGKWMIQSIATLPVVYWIELKPLEVGCIAAVINNANTDAVPLYQINMTKMPGTRCADAWWNTGGKDLITQVVTWIQTGQKNAIDAPSILTKYRGGIS